VAGEWIDRTPQDRQPANGDGYGVGAAVFAGLAIALDLYLLHFFWRGYLRAVGGNWGYVATRIQEKSVLISTALLLGLVLFGALAGALITPQGAAASRRGFGAAVGALTIHLALPVIWIISG
jgi:hypothetical protein